MHLPRARAVAVILITLPAIWLTALGCAKEQPPPAVPTEIQVTDIPWDNGTNIVISWRHFKASSASEYDIYFATSSDSLTDKALREKIEPIIRTVQVAVPTIGDTAENNVTELEYYVLLNEKEKGYPEAEVVKATPENRDSLEKHGEKITYVEYDVYPSDKSVRKLNYAVGNYYRVDPPNDEPKPQNEIFESSSIEETPEGVAIVDGKGSLILDVGMSQQELDFRKKGERILKYDPNMTDLLIKYGRQVIAFVTDENRYSLASENVQAVIRGDVEPGVQYNYLIEATDGEGGVVETELMEFSPVNDPPMAATGIQAVYDTADGRLLVSWTGYNPGLSPFRDVDRYEIIRHEPDDTTLESGEVLATYGVDHDSEILEGSFYRDDEFYIATYDSVGQRTVSETFGIIPGDISQPEMLWDLRVVDVDNDDGSGLAVRWGKPRIDLEYNIVDPSPEYSEVSLPKGYYLITGESDIRTLAHFEDGDSLIPDNAVPVLTAKQWVPAESFDVSVRYRMRINDGQDVLYANLSVDGEKPQNDFQETGAFIIREMPAGEHIFKSTLLNSAGRELENPEAQIVDTVIIDRPGVIWADEPPQIVQVWRANPAIIETSEVDDSIGLAVILKSTPHFNPDNPNIFELVGLDGILKRQHRDAWPDSLRDKGEYFYFTRVVNPDGGYVQSDIRGPMTPRSQIFHKEKTMVLILVILFVAFVNFFLFSARKGRKFYLRPIAGISHLDEALGRATEMGKPILYVLGLSGIQDIATLAGLTILGKVAKKAAEFQTKLIVPCVDPIVLIVAQETVKTACMDAGRPDVFDEDSVFYAAGSQFSYAAAVAGLMVRHKTAANFYMGMFFAESLILTETGAMTGSIQIAGTDAITQIPFFITSCDYTLIGEELYAASAYLSRDPMQVGTLKAQDMLKAIYMVVIVLGTIAMTSGMMWFVNQFHIRLEQ